MRRQTAKHSTVFVGKLSREAKVDVVVALRVLRRRHRGEPETSWVKPIPWAGASRVRPVQR
jgi:hypothetical protein